MPATAKSLKRPDDTRTFPNGSAVIIDVDGMIVGRGVLQPGWRWSNDVKPIAGTVSCEIPHAGCVLGGQLHVEMDDGSAVDLTEGDIYVISAGHDAWVVGSDPCVSLEWSGHADEFARASA